MFGFLMEVNSISLQTIAVIVSFNNPVPDKHQGMVYHTNILAKLYPRVWLAIRKSYPICNQGMAWHTESYPNHTQGYVWRVEYAYAVYKMNRFHCNDVTNTITFLSQNLTIKIQIFSNFILFQII